MSTYGRADYKRPQQAPRRCGVAYYSSASLKRFMQDCNRYAELFRLRREAAAVEKKAKDASV